VPIFANGPGTPQTTVVGTSSVQVFNPAAAGLTGALRNAYIQNVGTATAYVSSGTGAAATVAASVALPPNAHMGVSGSAVSYYAITSSGTTTLVAGLSTLHTNE
jgi:hypothetical protein